MICPKCGAAVEDGLQVCPQCQAPLNETVEAQPAPVDTPVEAAPAEAPAPVIEAAPKKKFPLAAVIIAALVIVAAVVIAIIGSKTAPAPAADPAAPSASQSAEGEQAAEETTALQIADYTEATLDGSVLACENDDFKISVLEFNYYYWGEYYYMLTTYGSSIGNYFDTTMPLDQQTADGTQTWADYIREGALNTIIQTHSLCAKANAEGFTLPDEDRQSLDDTLASLQTYADQYGYDSIDAYISASYGANSDYESFSKYLEDSFLATAYSDKLYADISITDEDIEAFFDAHASDYATNGLAKDETKVADIRLLVKVYEADADGNITDGEKEATKGLVQTLYDTWKEQGSTEEAFAQLAADNSDDTSTAASGGLLSSLAPNQTVDSVNDWVFAEGRKAGDCELVESDYGWNLIYYVATGDYYWKLAAQSDLMYETLYGSIDQITAEYTYQVDKAAIDISVPEDVSSQYKAQSSGSDASAEPAGDAVAEAETAEGAAPAETTEAIGG